LAIGCLYPVCPLYGSMVPTTIARLREAAERLAKPKSEVVREAIQDYYERVGKLSERERLRMLELFD